MADPTSSLLTGSQREYLRGDSDPSNEYQMQSRIQDRVYTGLRLDGMILKEMEPSLRRRIFREWENRDAESLPNGTKIKREDAIPEQFEMIQLEKGLEGLLGFLYLGIDESSLSDFEEILESAVDGALRERGQHLKSLDLDIETGDLATIGDVRRMVEDGELELEELTISEIHAMLEADMVDVDDFPEGYVENLQKTLEAADDLKAKFDGFEPEDLE